MKIFLNSDLICVFSPPGYNKLIRPVQNMTQKVQVAFGLAFIQLINVVSFSFGHFSLDFAFCWYFDDEKSLLISILPKFSCQLLNFCFLVCSLRPTAALDKLSLPRNNSKIKYFDIKIVLVQSN